MSSVPFRGFWTSFSFYIHPWPLDGSKMVRYDWSLPVQSGGCRFDPYDFEACVVFSYGSNLQPPDWTGKDQS